MHRLQLCCEHLVGLVYVSANTREGLKPKICKIIQVRGRRDFIFCGISFSICRNWCNLWEVWHDLSLEFTHLQYYTVATGYISPVRACCSRLLFLSWQWEMYILTDIQASIHLWSVSSTTDTGYMWINSKVQFSGSLSSCLHHTLNT